MAGISKVTGGGIADGTLSVADIADDAITADKLANSINTDIATGVTGNTTAGNALPKAGGAMTGAITSNNTISDVEGNVRSGRKNLLINGDFQVSQRGDWSSLTNINTTTTLFVDRWKGHSSAVSSSVQHKTGYPYANDKYIRVEATSSGSGYIRAYQMHDGNLNGKAAIFSAMVKSNSSNARLITHVGNTWTSNDTTAKHTGGGAWEKLTFAYTGGDRDVPLSVIGITGATHGALSISSGDYIEVANVQLELGSVATDFEHRSYGEELALCQRYYQPLCSGNHREYIYNVHRFNRTYSTPMRAVPTFIISHTGSATPTGVDLFNGATTDGSVNSWVIAVSTTSIGLAGGSNSMVDIVITATADAEL